MKASKAADTSSAERHAAVMADYSDGHNFIGFGIITNNAPSA